MQQKDVAPDATTLEGNLFPQTKAIEWQEKAQ